MQPLLQDDGVGLFPHLTGVRFAYIWPLATCWCWCSCVHVFHLDVVLSGRTWREPHITFGTICSLIQLYIGYGIQVLNARNDHIGKFLPLLTSHPLSFFMLGKKSSCLFPLWDLVLQTVYVTTKISSSQIFNPLTKEFSAMCDLVLLATYIISWWCHGPGTANCVHYCQNFILSDFSSSHRRVFSNVWPGTTSYIRYFLVMSWTWYF